MGCEEYGRLLRPFYYLHPFGLYPNWLQAEQKFKCPCHGSGYYITGVNFEGPAPRPLSGFHIILTDDGLIQIDESDSISAGIGSMGIARFFFRL
jgi:cytochrome b6-f complex iron-sulfur subunit